MILYEAVRPFVVVVAACASMDQSLGAVRGACRNMMLLLLLNLNYTTCTIDVLGGYISWCLFSTWKYMSWGNGGSV